MSDNLPRQFGEQVPEVPILIPDDITRDYLVELARYLRLDKVEHLDKHIVWNEVAAADSVTLSAGTSNSAVADLQNAHDGSGYSIVEVAASPGSQLTVDFVNIEYFNLIQILANYSGSPTHFVNIELYNWDTSSWDIFNTLDGIERSLVDHSFIVPDATNYIGAGNDEGKVRVRFNHPEIGDIIHTLYIDVVKLYK